VTEPNGPRPAIRWFLLAIVAILVTSVASLATRRAMQPADPPAMWLDSDALAGDVPPPVDAIIGEGILMDFPWTDPEPLRIGQRVDLVDPAGRLVAKAVPVVAVGEGTVTLDLAITAADRVDQTRVTVVAPWRQ
jgi:hypothetical protein